MIAKRSMTGLSLVIGVLLAASGSQAQVPQSGVSGHRNQDLSTPALKYFGRGWRTPVPPSSNRRQAPSTAPRQVAGGKPFQNLHRRPAISPYNNLDAIESSVGLPNYYSRVLPQIRQQQDLETQAAQLRRLQQQVRLANAPGVSANLRNGGAPTTGQSRQFLNSGGYFPTAQR